MCMQQLRCSDIAALARAAVSGDESALDMFNWKQKGKSNLKLSGMLGHNEAMTFYIGTQNGALLRLNHTKYASITSNVFFL